jgi:hypothetical protein
VNHSKQQQQAVAHFRRGMEVPHTESQLPIARDEVGEQVFQSFHDFLEGYGVCVCVSYDTQSPASPASSMH